MNARSFANRNDRSNLQGLALASLAWIAGLVFAAADALPNLKPTAAWFSGPAIAAQNAELKFTITNAGSAAIDESAWWYEYAYFSTDTIPDEGDTPLFGSWRSGPQNPGANFTQTQSVTIPSVAPGTYYLIVRTDYPYDQIEESNETDNTQAYAVNVLAPNLTPSAAWFTGPAVAGLNAEINFTINNTGTGPTHEAWWFESVYLSTDNVFDEADTLLWMPWHDGPLAAGASHTQTFSISVPKVAPGNYHLIVRADTPDDRVYESNETDNTRAYPVEILAANLVPTAAWFTNPPISGLPGELNFTVANRGNGTTSDSWYDSVYLSTDGEYDDGDIHLGSPWRAGSLAPDGTYTQSLSVPTVPGLAPGTYHLIVRADTPYDAVFESSETDNTVAFPITLTAANLVPANAWFTTAATAGETLEINVRVTNTGDANLPHRGWWDSIYISTDNTFDGNDTPLWTAWHEGPLPAGGSYILTGSVTVPAMPPGDYFLIVRTDYPSEIVPESNEADNTAAFPLVVGTPDLRPEAAAFVGLGMSGETATVTFTTRNIGNGSVGSRTWYDRLYLSADAALDQDDTMLVNHFACTGPLGPDGTCTISTGCQLPPVVPGGFYLIVSSDDYSNQVNEADENNNVRAFAVQVVGPDLEPAAAGFVGGSGSSGEVSRLRFTVRNKGVGGVAHRGWWDRVFFSRNPVLDGQETLIVDHQSANGPLQPGETYARELDAYVPPVPAGTYYLIVWADTYMNYLPESDETNNIVAFQVNVVGPDLRPEAAAFHNGPASSGEPATVDFTVRNTGAGGVSSRGWYDRVYLSQNATLDTGVDRLLVNHTAASGPLAAGETYSRSIPLTALPLVPPGTYYLLVSTDDYENYLIEADETNNVRAFQVTVVAPDLVSTELAITSGVPASEAVLGLDCTISNGGTGPAPAGRSWYDMVYLSTNPIWDPGYDQPLLSTWPEKAGPVAPGGSYTHSVSVTLPALSIGTYHLLVVADFWSNQLYEGDENNNPTAFPIKIGPDLEPQGAAITGGPAVSGRAANLSLIAGNTGNAGIDGTALWTDRAFLSSDALLDEGDTLLETIPQGGPLAAGATRSNDVPITLPELPPGDYYLILACDQAGNTVEEADETNNVRAYPVRITAPDLVVVAAAPQSPQVVPGQLAGVDFRIANEGDGPALSGESWSDDLWFSTDAVWDTGDTLLGGPWSRSGPFAPAASYDSNRKFLVPSVTPGTYYLIVRTDVAGQVIESNNGNNLRSVQIEVLAPDLVPHAAAVTGQLVQGRPFVCEITVNNAGLSAVPAGAWQDTLHLSSDPALDGGDTLLGGPWNETGPVAAGTGYTRSRSLTLPNVTAGTWYLIVTTDSGNTVAEADNSNNIRAFEVTVLAVDLAPTAITAAAPLVAGLAAELTVTVTNQGDGAAPAGDAWHDHLYFSTDDELGDGDVWIGSPSVTGPLAAGTGYQRIYQTTLPAINAGNYFLIAETDINGTVMESNDANNRLVVPVMVTQPDLSPVALALAAGNPLVAGQANVVEFEVANQGTGPVPAGTSRTDAAYLSSDSVLDPDDTLIGGPWTESGELAASAGYTRSREVTVTGVPGGAYFLLLVTDHDDDLFESDETDNTLAVEIEVESKPDLRPTGCGPAGGALNAGRSNNIIYTIINEGTAPAAGIWWDSFFLSSDAILDPDDDDLGWGPGEAGPIGSGDDYSREISVNIPRKPPGNYYLLLKADGYGESLIESDETDNLLAVLVVVAAPDLRPSACAAAGTLVSGLPNLLGYTILNDGGAETPVEAGWYDAVYLSSDATLDREADRLLGWSGWENGPVAAGATYERTMKFTMPVVAAGTHYLIVAADDYNNSLFEGDDADNVVAFPVTVTAMDLRPTAFAVTSGTPGSGETLTLDYTAMNAGDAAIPDDHTWWDGIYLSADAEMGPGDIFLGWSPEKSGTLGIGTSYSQSVPVTLPALAEGTWHLLVMTDAWTDQIPEGEETNNVRAIQFNVGASFASWAATNGLFGENALPGANPSGDGINNLLKYAFGMDPNIAYGPDRHLTPGSGTSGLPLVTMSGGRLRIEFVRRINATDLTYTAQFGSDLTNSGPGGWLASGPGTPTPIPGMPGWERVIVEDAAAPPGAITRFGRVAVASD
jgi:subtilase family serine protease